MANVNTNVAHIPPSPMQGERLRARPMNACPHCGGPVTTALAKILNEKVPGDLRRRTYADSIAEAIVVEALKGNVQAFKEIADRIEGKPTEAPPIVPNRPPEFVVVYAPPFRGESNPGFDPEDTRPEHVESA